MSKYFTNLNDFNNIKANNISKGFLKSEEESDKKQDDKEEKEDK
jgi:hypothetical protein